MIFSLLSAHAMGRGSGASNNAGGLMCPEKAYLFDLWEATIPTIYTPEGLHISEYEGSVKDLVEKKLNLMRTIDDEGYADYVSKVKENYELARSIAKPLPKMAQPLILPIPLDLGQAFTREDCKLRGLISWDDESNRIFYDGPLYSQLSTTHKAAMWIHEAVYKTLRDIKWVSYSSETRRIVSYLFSDSQNIDPKKIFPTNLRGYGDLEPQLFKKISLNYYFKLFDSSCAIKSIYLNGIPKNQSPILLDSDILQNIVFEFEEENCKIEYAILAANHEEYKHAKSTLTQDAKAIRVNAVFPK